MLTEPRESLAAVNAERFSMLVSDSVVAASAVVLAGRPGLWGDGHETRCSAPAGSPWRPARLLRCWEAAAVDWRSAP
jgi:hypothetical protein